MYRVTIAKVVAVIATGNDVEMVAMVMVVVMELGFDGGSGRRCRCR